MLNFNNYFLLMNVFHVVSDRRVMALRPPFRFGRGWDRRLEELEAWLVLVFLEGGRDILESILVMLDN